MCAHFQLFLDKEEYADFAAAVYDAERRVYEKMKQLEEADRYGLSRLTGDFWPGYMLPVVAPSSTGKLKLTPMSWGYWWQPPQTPEEKERGKPPKKPKRQQNARLTTCKSPKSELWHDSFNNRRCLIVASAFEEFNNKKPYTFFHPGALLYIAAIWKPYQAIEGVTMDAKEQARAQWPQCSMVTTVPNESVQAIHDRMPLVLGTSPHDEDVQQWLYGDDYGALGDREHIFLDKVKK